MRGLLIFIYVFFLVLGPKIGYFDSSVFIPIAILPLLIQRPLVISRGYWVFAALISLLICYQLLVQMFNGVFEFEAVGRLIRSLAAVFLIAVLLGSSLKKPWNYWIRLTVFVIALHSIVVILGAIFPQINSLTALMLEADRIREFRSSGFMAGYDIAGVISIFGLLIVVFLSKAFSSKTVAFSLAALFIGATVFESRVSFAASLVVAMFWVLRILVDRKIRFLVKMPLLIVSACALVVGIGYLLLILSVTFSLDIIQYDAIIRSGVVSRFAAYDASSGSLSSMFFLPETLAQQIFGAGAEPGNSDVGYVREIFRYGVLGLLLAIGAHAAYIFSGNFKGIPKSMRRDAVWLIISIISVMLLFSFKNNYIFVRGAFPLFLLVVGAVRYSRPASGETN